MVSDVFVFDLMAIAPPGCEEFTDYILDNYISESSKFPPNIWSECSSSLQRTTNACEAFHSKFNSSFYSSHPNIFQFIEVLKSFQINTYVLINSIDTPKKDYRKKKHLKIGYLEQQIENLKKNNISPLNFIKNISFKFQPV
jgi:hypothetical protein